jgi:hypothetical protein
MLNIQLQTQNDLLKEKVISIAKKLLAEYKEDIETGIEERIYVAEDNVDNLKWIEQSEKEIDQFTAHVPNVYIFVEGGNIQGASADSSVFFQVYDKDNLNNDEETYVEHNGTLDEWNEMIITRTKSGELKPIY